MAYTSAVGDSSERRAESRRGDVEKRGDDSGPDRVMQLDALCDRLRGQLDIRETLNEHISLIPRWDIVLKRHLIDWATSPQHVGDDVLSNSHQVSTWIVSKINASNLRDESRHCFIDCVF